MDIKQLLEEIRESAKKALDSDQDTEELRIRFLGKKGELTSVLRNMGQVPPEERPQIGQLVNNLRNEIEEKY